MPAQENPAAATDAPPPKDEKDPTDPHNMTIDEVESGLACCTLCPPRIRCICCSRDKEKVDTLRHAKMGFFGAARRKCNDLFCLVLFIIFWCGMLGIGGFALSSGNPAAILYGSDYRGKTCGVAEGLENKKLTAYPRLVEDAILNAQKTDVSEWSFYGVCVEKCPQRLSVLCNPEAPAGADTFNASQSEYCITRGLEGTAPTPASWCADNKIRDRCWVVPLATTSILFRCVPQINSTTRANASCTYPSGITDPYSPSCLVRTSATTGTVEEPAQESKLVQQLSSVQSLWSRYFGDISRAFVPIMLCSVFIAIALGFVALLLLQYLTWAVVIIAILGTILGLGGMAVFCFIKAGVLTAPALAGTIAGNAGVNLGAAVQDSTQTAFSIAGYVFVALAIAALVLAVVLRNAITTTVATITIAANAVASNPVLLLIPLGNTAAILALLAWWAYTAAALMSITSPVEIPGFSNTSTLGSSLGFNTSFAASGFTKLEQDDVMQYLQFYNLFGLLWTGQFILYVGFLVVSGTAASWYFARNKAECEANNVPVFDAKEEPSACCGLCSCGIFRTLCCLSCHRTFRFHLGSIAFASLIVAIIAAVRLFVTYIQTQLEKIASRGVALLQCILCYVQYCLGVVDCIVRTISRNAFVFIAIKGHSFIPAGGKALGFIIANVSTFSALNVLSAIILFLLKLFIAGVSAAACWSILENPDSGYEVTSSWLPSMVTFVFAYLVAAVFTDVYDASIDTILIAYVMDKTENERIMHGRDPKPGKSADEDDIGADVEDAQGAHEGKAVAKPKRSSLCVRIFCCCCFLCGRSEAQSEPDPEAETELAKAGGSAAASSAAGPAAARSGE